MTAPAPFEHWSLDLIAELDANRENGRVGSQLVSETDDVRVWHLHLAPGVRFGFHTHVLDYFWTSLSDGKGRQHYGDGSVREVTYAAGDTKHSRYAAGERMHHDLENIGDTDLVFVTVEFKRSANAPLPL